MSGLERAIKQLEGELVLQGTENSPQDLSVEWWILRARALGLSWLRTQARLEHSDRAPAAERHYRASAQLLKRAESD